MRIRSQVEFSRVSGLSQDVCVNTFHASMTGAADEADLDAWHDRLALFYNGPSTDGDGIHAYLSPVLSRAAGGVIIKSYDIDAGPPSVPLYTSVTALGPMAAGGQPYPSEVACCLSFKAEAVTGENAARRRGRVYIGPVITLAGTTGTLDPRPRDDFSNTVLDAAELLAQPTDPPGANLDWRGHSVADDLLWFIERVWVDNAFDTQRRRGPDPTSRLLRVV